MKALLLLFLPLVLGCYPEKTETPTTGHLHVLIPESAAPPLIREVEAFLSIYGPRGAYITYDVVQSEFAVARFVLDTANMVFSTIALTKSEEAVVRGTAGSLRSIVVAYDGVAVVVHHSNTTERITTTELRNLLRGSLTRWEQLSRTNGKTGPITVYLQDSSDASTFLAKRVMGGSSYATRRQRPGSSLEVLRSVNSDPAGIGFAGLAWIDSARVPVKQLEVASTEPEADTAFISPPEAKGGFYSAHPAHVYRTYYPLKRAITMYTKSLKGDLASGFGTYVANKDGQKIFLDRGLVPATQPIRLRNPQ